MRRLASHIVAHRTNTLCIYTKEIIGQLRWDAYEVSNLQEVVCRKQELKTLNNTAPSHYVDSVVGVMLEAVQNYNLPLCKKLCA